jgi:tetratricopeptide (TPR) repeat protein
MAKVSLRVYNREIEGMIEGGRLDESVAHCQHILKTFPMHVETYRLLGKSFLEARRYTDAADIFQRALMAVPDDFVAQVGMSIIRDDEGKLDDAIWHMERAFEDQPSNSAIQGELRRLYGRRDGIEPPKIRLSRDALANMYSQGALFNQAIAEIRAVLAEDVNRPDLQVMLARAYYHAGQKVEAAEMAANLLKKYTYCLDALRILVDVLPGTANAENTQVYRQRLLMLDPYSAFVSGSAFSTDQVPDAAVNLERLEYKAGAAPAVPQPNWASSLGIKLADEKRVEPAPDWMKTADSSEQTPAAESDPSGPTAVPNSDDKPIPDWMNTAEWKESSGNTQEVLEDLNAAQPAEPLAKADIPDWLKSMAPQEVTDAVKPGYKPDPVNTATLREENAPDWLGKLGTSAADKNPEPSQPAASSQEKGAFPDWLKEIGDGASAKTGAAFVADALETPKTEEPPDSSQPLPLTPVAQSSDEPLVSALGPDDETPFKPTDESKPLNIEDDAMAWLESLAAKQGAKEEELLTKPEDRSEEMPDWLRSAEEKPSASIAPEQSLAPNQTLPLEPTTPLAGEMATHEPALSEELPSLTSPAESTAQPLNIEDDSMAWLESLAAEQGAKEEEILNKPEDRPEEIADNLYSAEEKPSTSVAPEQSLAPNQTLPLEPSTPFAGEMALHEPAPSEELPPLTSPAEGTAQPFNVEDDSMAWLKDLADKQDSKPDEVLIKPDEHAEVSHDWIPKTIQEQAAPDEALAPEQSQEDITITSWLKKQDVEEALGISKSTTDIPKPAAKPSEELPDWLKALEKPVTPEETPKATNDLPDWLRQPAQPTDQGAAAVPTVEPAPELEIPAWIDETIPVSGTPAPTTPGEWVPVDEKPAPVPDLKPVAEPAPAAVAPAVQLRVLGGTGMLARIPSQDKDAEFLAVAQAALDASQLNESMQAYSKLIKKNRLLDEVIHDLREAIYRFPVDIIVWQTLGDAYMRTNRLQDALDAYTKAEELLR